jgi:hypothetical protein
MNQALYTHMNNKRKKKKRKAQAVEGRAVPPLWGTVHSALAGEE